MELCVVLYIVGMQFQTMAKKLHRIKVRFPFAPEKFAKLSIAISSVVHEDIKISKREFCPKNRSCIVRTSTPNGSDASTFIDEKTVK